MKIIIHGNDTEKSREFFYQGKNKLQNPVSLEGEGLIFDLLFQASENKSLFDEQIVLLIENLFSKNKTNSLEVKKIIEFLNHSKKLSVILWEQTELSKTTLSALKNFEIKTFIIPRKMFVFLDQLKPGNSKHLIKLHHELLETQGEELILFMIIRQFRLFLQAADNYSGQIDEVKRMAPWQLSKLKSQVNYFNKEHLINLYNQLFEIEKNHKSGKVPFSETTSIDFFLGGL